MIKLSVRAGSRRFGLPLSPPARWTRHWSPPGPRCALLCPAAGHCRELWWQECQGLFPCPSDPTRPDERCKLPHGQGTATAVPGSRRGRWKGQEGQTSPQTATSSPALLCCCFSHIPAAETELWGIHGLMGLPKLSLVLCLKIMDMFS